jgi:hypothetical protein
VYHFHGFPDEAVAYFQNTAFVADLTLDLDQLLSRIHYLGPSSGACNDGSLRRH